jgi:hypothetical protein
MHFARFGLHDRARQHDPPDFMPSTRLKTHWHGPCSTGPQQPEPEIGTMGTELIIVGVTVFFYALCALFVRVCDRI